MKKQKNSFLLTLGLGVLLLNIFLISAVTEDIVFVTPTSYSNISGLATLNVTGYYLDNCTVYVKSLSTGNTSWTAVAVIENLSSPMNDTNGNFSTMMLEDGRDYIFNATCRNITQGIHYISALVTNIRVDNGVPSTPTALYPASDTLYPNQSVYFSVTVLGQNTTNCTLYFVGTNPGFSTYKMTHSDNTCTQAITMPEQRYQWYIIADDGTNSSSATATTNLVIGEKHSAGKVGALLSQPGVTSTGGATFAVTGDSGFGFFTQTLGDTNIPVYVLIIVIVIVVGYIIWRRKK